MRWRLGGGGRGEYGAESAEVADGESVIEGWGEVTASPGVEGGGGEGGGGKGDGGLGGGGEGVVARSTGSNCSGHAPGWLASANLLATLSVVPYMTQRRRRRRRRRREDECSMQHAISRVTGFILLEVAWRLPCGTRAPLLTPSHSWPM